MYSLVTSTPFVQNAYSFVRGLRLVEKGTTLAETARVIRDPSTVLRELLKPGESLEAGSGFPILATLAARLHDGIAMGLRPDQLPRGKTNLDLGSWLSRGPGRFYDGASAYLGVVADELILQQGAVAEVFRLGDPQPTLVRGDAAKRLREIQERMKRLHLEALIGEVRGIKSLGDTELVLDWYECLTDVQLRGLGSSFERFKALSPYQARELKAAIQDYCFKRGRRARLQKEDWFPGLKSLFVPIRPNRDFHPAVAQLISGADPAYDPVFDPGDGCGGP